MKNEKILKITTLAIIAFHFTAVVLHSVAHKILMVKASAAQLAFIVPVIIFAPVISGFLLPKLEKTGAVLLTLSMTGSFVFGLYYHFIAHTIDHVERVAHLEPAVWAAMFNGTAYLLAVSEILGAFAGFFILIKGARFSKSYAV